MRVGSGWLMVSLLIWGCGGGDGGTRRDAGSDSGPAADGGRGDAGGCAAACTTAGECDDGVFCNGAEECAGGCCAPSAASSCDDGLDCTVDSCDEGAMTCASAAPDVDGDGYGDAACLDAGGSPLGDDCDDADDTRHPGAAEECDGDDEDCDDATFGSDDRDTDSYVSSDCCNGDLCGDDCDDSRRDVHPTLVEVCDMADNDCNGAIDEGSTVICYTDADADRYAAAGAAMIETCACPVRTTTMAPGVGTTDCDDGEMTVHPAATETCDYVDNDCDGMNDEGFRVSCWADADDDGYALATAAEMSLCVCGPGTTPRRPGPGATDCNDASAAARPDGGEGCTADAIDNDCDGVVDDLDGTNWYPDCDVDSYGARGSTAIRSCVMPGSVPPCGGGGGWATSADDCDDRASAVRPGTRMGDTIPPELCDNVDNDCNAATADGLSEPWRGMACDGADGDLCREGTLTCGAGGVDMVCNDPVAETDREVCGGGDEDCDTTIDEAAAANADCTGRALPHTTAAVCTAGTCRPSTCETGWNDCVTATAGCETMCQWRGCAGALCDDPIRVSTTGSGSTSYSCAVRRSGQVVCWGAVPTGSSTTPVAIAGATMATDVDAHCVLRSDGTVGLIDSTGFRTRSISSATQVSCGGRGNCVLRSDRTVYCYGQGFALGIGSTSDAGLDGTVSGLGDAIDVSVGAFHACAVRATGRVVCWGGNHFGQLGDGVATHSTCSLGDCATTPVEVAGITDAREVMSGYLQSCARRATGDVVCWGNGRDLGDGLASHGETCPGWGTPTDCSRRPVPVPAASPASSLEGSSQSQGGCVVRPTGVVSCWTNYTTPTDVPGFSMPTDLGRAGTITGNTFTCAIDASGLRCMGANGTGQLGDGTTMTRASPVSVLPPP